MGEKVTDQQLVERVQQGDKKGLRFAGIKVSAKSRKFSFALCAETRVMPWMSHKRLLSRHTVPCPSFRGDSAFYTWMYRIAVNTAKNHLAQMSRRPFEAEQDISEAEQFQGESALKDNASPEHLMMRDQIQEVVAKTIDNLPEDLKTAITLRELEGLSYEDIASVMECPIGTVRSRIFRAREAIDKELKPLIDFR